MSRTFFGTTAIAIALLLVACESQDDGFVRRNVGPGDGAGDDPGDPTQPGNCPVGQEHAGFGNVNAVGDRVAGGIGNDRRRVKPYSALPTEFQRALGAVPAAMAGASAAYGDVPARWYSEPTAGAISLYTTYSLAFTGCYDTMTDAKFAQAPVAATADAECREMQRKFWQRTGTPEEVAACVDLAMTGVGGEPVARRRWAHACASIMTATGFTTF